MTGATGRGASSPSPSDHAAEAERAAARHADLQALVLDASTTLISANPDELRTKLEWTLSSVATGLDAEYAAVYVDPDGEDTDVSEFERRYDWSDGETSDDDAADEVTDIAPLLTQVREDGVVRFSRASGSSYDAPTDLRVGGVDVESLLAVPIVRDWELWGALVFAGPQPREQWHDQEVVLVRSLADMIANSLARVERERRLAAQNERLEQFASVVSHDLRNPLNVVMGSLELAEETGEAAHFERARRATDRMDGIIDNVLGLARAGQDIGETASVRVGRVARDAWDTVDTGTASLSVDGPGVVDADETRLSDALSNLFRNAVEHGGEDVTVTVADRPDGSGFYVADDGGGLPGDAEMLFERGTTGEDDNTGIGLSIVEQVVEAHGWSVEAGESSTGGARFDIVVEE
ncbi:sensor histidine kinase [Halobaculum limi]|uniref:sensor histidine kinase n=1 Tax=Halobaculum limi TaxID=3031916 RepID=UPI0024055FBA|nr:HAMP domain-containing sensor histidine kinase [Halobaculum sp. YSMS11]